MHYGRLLPADQKLCRNAVGIIKYNSLDINYPQVHNALSNENVKWNFCDTSYKHMIYDSLIYWCHPEQLCLSSRRGFASPHSSWFAHSPFARVSGLWLNDPSPRAKLVHRTLKRNQTFQCHAMETMNSDAPFSVPLRPTICYFAPAPIRKEYNAVVLVVCLQSYIWP